MRIVTYARVSKKATEEERGSSLVDQEARFAAWLEETGHTRVRAYAEEKSGGTVTQRKKFQQMLSDLRVWDPPVDAVVVDSLDRYTRDAGKGFEIHERLKELNVALWELEFSAERPLNPDDDDDWRYMSSKFIDAEAERRRIRKRQVKRYEQQRQRGATTTNRPAFGLRLAGDRKGHRKLVPDPKTAPIVQEMDRRILAGESQRSVLKWLAAFPGAWRSRRGMGLALLDDDDAYVTAGVRSPETQAALRELAGKNRKVFGPDRTTKTVHEHALSGLIGCEECIAAGVPAERARLHGRYITANKYPHALVCSGVHDGKSVHREQYFGAHLVMNLLLERLERLRDPDVAQAVLDRWHNEPKADPNEALRDSIEQALAQCDTDEALLTKRANNAMTLMMDDDPGIADEARRFLKRVSEERAEIEASRVAHRLKLSKLPAPRNRAAMTLGDLQIEASHFPLYQVDEDGLRFNPSVRDVLKKWVDAIGAPTIERRMYDNAPGKAKTERIPGKRRQKPKLVLKWPLVDAIRDRDFDWGPEVYDVTDTYRGPVAEQSA